MFGRNKVTKVLMICEDSGCGWWRMMLPAKHMNQKKFDIVVTDKAEDFEKLLDFDTIFVQRLFDESSLELVKKLREKGKHIVCDWDDDPFNVPVKNPASKIFNAQAKRTAKDIMAEASAITVTGEVLMDEIGMQDKTVIIPNALDANNGWRKIKEIGSPDGKKRIFWQGSSTHGEDWLQCINAVDRVVRDNDDVLLLVIGWLHPVLEWFVQDPMRPWWRDKIEYTPYLNSTEEYFDVLKRVRADVALAPLQDSKFNSSKSAIKWMEYSMAGIPTVASNVTPYKDVIGHGFDGLLVNGEDEWEDAIKQCLRNPKMRMKMVKNARRKVGNKFNIKKVAKQWEKVLSP